MFFEFKGIFKQVYHSKITSFAHAYRPWTLFLEQRLTWAFLLYPFYTYVYLIHTQKVSTFSLLTSKLPHLSIPTQNFITNEWCFWNIDHRNVWYSQNYRSSSFTEFVWSYHLLQVIERISIPPPDDAKDILRQNITMLIPRWLVVAFAQDGSIHWSCDL